MKEIAQKKKDRTPERMSGIEIEHRDTAVGWLRAAFDAGTNFDGLEAAVEHAPELTSLYGDPRFAQLKARLDS